MLLGSVFGVWIEDLLVIFVFMVVLLFVSLLCFDDF